MESTALNHRIKIIITILITYFLLMMLTIFYLNWRIEAKSKHEHLIRNMIFRVQKLSEDGYNTELKLWKYSNTPSAERFQQYKDNLESAEANLSILNEQFNKNESLLTLAIKEKILEINDIANKIRPQYLAISKAVQQNRKHSEIKETIAKSAEVFEAMQLNAKVDNIIDQFKRSSDDIEQSNREFGQIAFYIVILEITFAIFVTWLGYRYIKWLQNKNETQQEQINLSSKFAALGEMAGGIAHEINNPLATMISVSGQMRDILEDENLDKKLLKEMANNLEKTGNRIAKIISGMRTFSRDGSKDPFQKTTVKPFIEETLSICSDRLKSSETKLIVDPIAEELSIEIRGSQLSQVIVNLLNNAIDAIAELPEKWIKVSVKEVNEYIELSITDSGKGISKEIEEKIFQPFFTTKGVGKGTGMGLSISSRILADHNGSLSIDKTCKHTRFLIFIPKKQNNLQKAS